MSKKAANSARGEAVLVGISGAEYHFKFGTNAICRAEDILNKSLGEILSALNGNTVSMKTIRVLVQTAITDPPNPELDQVGDIIDDVGMLRLTTALSQVFSEGGDETSADPSNAAAGSGVSSS